VRKLNVTLRTLSAFGLIREKKEFLKEHGRETWKREDLSTLYPD
jgi:hypothetical protein